jgi:xanthine dehydrogenase accessory factor
MRRPGPKTPPLALVPQGAQSAQPAQAVQAVQAEAGALPVPVTADVARVLQIAAGCVERGIPAALATVVARHGSAPGTPGQKLLLGKDGTCLGTVGGGAVEREVLSALQRFLVAGGHARRDGEAQLRTFKLGAELGMCCGGRLDILLEPLIARVPCLVVGAGHVGTALAPMLARLGFAVTVVDEREAWADPRRLDFAGVRAVNGEHDEVGRDIDPRGICLAMTHDHALDQAVIAWALRRGFAFVGGVGSRAKAERTRQRLEAKGFSEADCARVRMPVGLDIGARLPEEIAIAIAAELVAWRKRT